MFQKFFTYNKISVAAVDIHCKLSSIFNICSFIHCYWVGLKNVNAALDVICPLTLSAVCVFTHCFAEMYVFEFICFLLTDVLSCFN
jgi:hypothetical protein